MGNRIKGYLSNIHRFYTWNSFDHISFGYVIAAKRVLPRMSTTKALHMFLDDFGLCEDQYCFDNARAAYYRILASLQDENMKGELDMDELDDIDRQWKQKERV